jgi:hypothetical protein
LARIEAFPFWICPTCFEQNERTKESIADCSDDSDWSQLMAAIENERSSSQNKSIGDVMKILTNLQTRPVPNLSQDEWQDIPLTSEEEDSQLDVNALNLAILAAIEATQKDTGGLYRIYRERIAGVN